jgi:maleylpyruvate isomerase
MSTPDWPHHIEGARAAHQRLDRTLTDVDEARLRAASRLPGWSVGHVLTHLARNAESHTRMLRAAQAGRAVQQYPGGAAQRAADIDAGAERPAVVVCADVRDTAAELEVTWSAMTPSAWAGHGLAGGIEWPCSLLPLHRWREVEVHHADLGLGYQPTDWPEEYVRVDLPHALAGLPDRLADDAARGALLAWLLDRGPSPVLAPLVSWQDRREYYFR